MALVTYKGPAKMVAYHWRRKVYELERGIPLEVPDEFSAYLMERSARSLEEAANYGEHVWIDSNASKASREKEADL
jgi:hypothetical protein